ncbi:hypothetical protein O8E88_001460 [Flavobacterium psychrophilum]|nr:hypothetical protein [Flavobacterium psychrophilum]EKT2069657.1 hypothetical protein [Flavobacterium psychrophilum]EKT2071917.1 hypothetical protein [Flavobacterium psychrophilum]EKT3962937.1 hypothetical protein [Flavobacterium psychrophilum]EKT4491439.1 hypothetical protein [Flavobacterium psychrophilum]EKT4498668.1 hypothetical protein [Flavobacterium psychrophilum]
MKRIFLVLAIFLLLTACGPRRLGCGPGKRCVEVCKKNNFEKNKDRKVQV